MNWITSGTYGKLEDLNFLTTQFSLNKYFEDLKDHRQYMVYKQRCGLSLEKQ